ncbi:MAG: ATP-binding protein [Alphaproteobacteria bacterium]|nr:ATP-binding protein [Alphaproteobacteria bacterium]
MSRAEDIFERLIYFGEDAIDEFILNRQTEELFMDFKQAVSDGKNMRALHQNDRRNLAKAISAFGNSEGGVLVWGVECSRDTELGDVAQAKVKVKNVHRFLSWLEGAISGCTIPSHNRVRNHIICSDKNGDGILATYIPKSDIAPLMTTSGSQIYIRSGSNNVPAPYSVIAGMFGKRPQPNIEMVINNKMIDVAKENEDDIFRPQKKGGKKESVVKVRFSLLAENNSNAIAKEVFLSCNTLCVGGDKNKVNFYYDSQLENLASQHNSINLITPLEMRIPPRALFGCAKAEIRFYNDITEDFLMEGVIGAEGSIPKSFRIYVSKNDLRSFVAQALRKNADLEVLTNEFFSCYLKKEM